MDVESIAESINNSGGKDNSSKLQFRLSRIIKVGLAFLSISMFWQVYDSLMPLFLKDFELKKTLIGVIMALDNILALVLLPLMGMFSDKLPQKMSSKFGRRMPFIIVGTILATIMFLLVNFAHNKNMLSVMMACSAMLLIFMCLYRTPAVALMPDVTPKKLRSQGNAVINIMGLIGGVVSLILMQFLLKTVDINVDGKIEKAITGDNWVLIGIICALMLLCALVMVFTVNENKLIAEKQNELEKAGIDDEVVLDEKERTTTKDVLKTLSHSQRKSHLFILISVALWYMAYNAVITWFSSYSYEALGIDFAIPLLLANIAAAAMFVPAVIIGKKIGRKNTVLIGVSMMALAFFFAIFLMASENANIIRFGIYPVLLFVGGGWATINVHSFVMSVEFATETTTGKFTGFYYTFAMGAQILTPIFSGFFIQKLGYVALMPYAFVFMILAFITTTMVRHGNSKDKPIILKE